MNFITPLLFVFYFQVMPPPPTMYGGGDYWAGNTNQNSAGNSVDLNWTFLELQFALMGVNTAGIGGYGNIYQVVTAIEQGWMTDLDYTEWYYVFIYAGNTGSASLTERACYAARNSNSDGQNAADDFSCPANVPISKELLFLIIFSFLGVYCFFKRDEFSKFINISSFNR